MLKLRSGGDCRRGMTTPAMTIAALDSAALRDLAAHQQNGAAADVLEVLRAAAAEKGVGLDAEALPAALDAQLSALPSSQRAAFCIPKKRTMPTDPKVANLDDDSVYLVGNSLGLQPRKTREYVNAELDSWSELGVNGHFSGRKTEWLAIDELVMDGTAAVVGALPSEVANMNSLTMNLHLLLISFYRPKGSRTKILYEADAFGSDFFAFESQVRLHGLDPAEALVPVKARDGSDETLRTEDIVKAIKEAGDSLAVVCFGTVQYYTGQYFDVEAITAAAHSVGAAAIWDCAHAVGNVDLKLHDWGVDGACWCSYKYLNAGPGGIGGFFVHEKHHGKNLNLLAGWWGQKKSTRFNMSHIWQPEEGASAWRLSNPPVLQTVSLLASLELFGKSSMAELRGRSLLLTGYLELLLQQGPLSDFPDMLSILTPSEPRARGCQLSIKFATSKSSEETFAGLERRGIVVDHRKPNVIRVSPAPLYSTFMDVFLFVRALGEALREIGEAPPAKRAKA